MPPLYHVHFHTVWCLLACSIGAPPWAMCWMKALPWVSYLSSCAWGMWSWKACQLSWATLSFRAAFPGIPPICFCPLLLSFLTVFKISHFPISWSLQPRLLLISTSPSCSSMSVKIRCSSLTDHSWLANPISVSWIYLWQSLETSWTAHFSSCWSSNWCQGRLNSFIRTKVNDSEASSCAPKKASSTFLRWWDTSNTHPLWCTFHRPFPWPTSSPPAHHLLHWGAPYTLFLSSPEESVQLLQECKLLPQISVIPTILQLSKKKFLFSVLLQYLRVYFIFRTASTGMESGRKNKTSFGYSKRIEEQPWLLLQTSANRQKHRYRRAKTAIDFGAQVEGSDGV